LAGKVKFAGKGNPDKVHGFWPEAFLHENPLGG
jgi:hypothetical protein